MYEVDSGANQEYAKGKLKYMEQENFEGGKLMDKTFYNDDQSLRGKEVYQYEADGKYPSGSKYYNKEGALLSTYKFEYQDSLKIEARGFEGDGGSLLRIEGFKYDNKGNLVSKTISDAMNQKQRSFLFGHDANGNEIKMVVLDEADNQVLSETFEIVTKTESGEWIEKWGYLNDDATPVTFYHKRKSDL